MLQVIYADSDFVENGSDSNVTALGRMLDGLDGRTAV
jgi:hypothetical protein